MRDVKAQCEGTYRAVHDSGVRRPSDIGWVVIHCTQGATAKGAAVWFTNPNSEGSANLVLDDDVCYRTVPDLRVPWAAQPLNTRGFHIELAGFVEWSREEWLSHPAMLDRAAYKTALRCRLYGIPVRTVGPIGLRLGRKGVTGHADVSRAWRKSDHTDPGPNFPWDRFIDRVKWYAAQPL